MDCPLSHSQYLSQYLSSGTTLDLVLQGSSTWPHDAKVTASRTEKMKKEVRLFCSFFARMSYFECTFISCISETARTILCLNKVLLFKITYLVFVILQQQFIKKKNFFYNYSSETKLQAKFTCKCIEYSYVD